MSTKNSVRQDSSKHSSQNNIIKSKFRKDNSFSYSPRKHSLQINSIKSKRNLLQITQSKLGSHSPCSHSNLNISYHLKNVNTTFEKRKRSVSIMRYKPSYNPSSKRVSIRRIEEGIKQKIFDMSMEIDLEENNVEIINNTHEKSLLNFSINSKKFENDSKENRSHIINMSVSENNNSIIQKGYSNEKSISVKNSAFKTSSSFSKHSKNPKKKDIIQKDVFRLIERKKLVYD